MKTDASFETLLLFVSAALSFKIPLLTRIGRMKLYDQHLL